MTAAFLLAGSCLCGDKEIPKLVGVESLWFRGLDELARHTPGRFLRGIVLYGGTEAMPFGPNTLALSVATVWRQHRRPIARLARRGHPFPTRVRGV